MDLQEQSDLQEKKKKKRGKKELLWLQPIMWSWLLTHFIFRLWWLVLFNKDPYKEENKK